MMLLNDWIPLLSAITGGLLTGLATIMVDVRRSNSKKRQLRRAFSAEIQGSSERMDTLLERVEGDQVPIQHLTDAGFPTEVYQQNLGDIGQLTESEIVAILEYYQNLTSLKKVLNKHRELHDSEQKVISQNAGRGDMIMFWEVSMGVRLVNLRYQQRAALRLLDSELY
jgi:hypothetical protein